MDLKDILKVSGWIENEENKKMLKFLFGNENNRQENLKTILSLLEDKNSIVNIISLDSN